MSCIRERSETSRLSTFRVPFSDPVTYSITAAHGMLFKYAIPFNWSACPPRGGLSTPRALKVQMTKSGKVFWSRNYYFLQKLQHILRVRICIHFQWFPHTPRPPMPLTRPEKLQFTFCKFPTCICSFTCWVPCVLWLRVPCRGHKN